MTAGDYEALFNQYKINLARTCHKEILSFFSKRLLLIIDEQMCQGILMRRPSQWRGGGGEGGHRIQSK